MYINTWYTDFLYTIAIPLTHHILLLYCWLHIYIQLYHWLTIYNRYTADYTAKPLTHYTQSLYYWLHICIYLYHWLPIYNNIPLTHHIPLLYCWLHINIQLYHWLTTYNRYNANSRCVCTCTTDFLYTIAIYNSLCTVAILLTTYMYILVPLTYYIP